MKKQKKIFKEKVTFCQNPMEALKGCDSLIILTEWKEFRSPDFKKMKSLINTSTIFDGRNLYHPKQVKSYGLSYYAIGR
jgi:UDPglucose 6-dehydrogenase